MTAVAPGETEIRAASADGEAYAALRVTVSPDAAPFRILSVTPDKAIAEAGGRITWTVSAAGENLTYDYLLYADGAMLVGAQLEKDGNRCSVAIGAPGKYELQVFVRDANGYTLTSEVSGAVEAYRFDESTHYEYVTLGGAETGGAYAAFGPDRALPDGYAADYSLALKEGSSAELTISAVENGVAQIDYAEMALGTTLYELAYAVAYGGETVLSGTREIDIEVRAASDLPASVSIPKAEYAVVKGQSFTLPLADIALGGGELTSADIAWRFENAAGETVGDGLTVAYADIGRYALTLKGAYAGQTLAISQAFDLIVTDEGGNAFNLTSNLSGDGLFASEVAFYALDDETYTLFDSRRYGGTGALHSPDTRKH